MSSKYERPQDGSQDPNAIPQENQEDLTRRLTTIQEPRPLGPSDWGRQNAAPVALEEAVATEEPTAPGEPKHPRRLDEVVRQAEPTAAPVALEEAVTSEEPTAPDEPDDKALRKARRSIRRHVAGKPTRPKDHRGYLGTVFHALRIAVRVTVIGLVALIVFGGGLGLGVLVGYISSTEPISAEMLTSFDQTSYVYDNENNLMAIQTGRDNINRTVISFSEVRNTYIDEAFKAVEDQKFDTNIGIDPKRIASATISALINGGEASHGGSTITQQTVKMLTGADDVSIGRKVQEWYSAVKLTEQLSKWEIMELYLNLVPMSNSYVGIQAGAQAYFAKDASDLNLAECAFLAGIPKSPVAYNPLREDGKRNALRRQRVILGMMKNKSFITEEEYQAALNYELVFRQEEQDFKGTDLQSYFTEYAIKETVRGLVKNRGYSESYARQLVSSGGISIYTTMEPKAQEALDRTYQKQELFQSEPELYIDLPEQPEAGTVILNNQTGAIAAMQGGFGDKPGNLVVNRATDIRRSPGSTIKSIGIYAPAIDMGLATGATIIRDEAVHMDPNNPEAIWPTNTYEEYRGDMTLRNSLKISNNVPAAKLLSDIGIDHAKRYLEQMGIDLSNDPVGMALSVGSLSQGLSPLQVASAYTVFPNGGLYTAPYSVKQVLDSRNNVLFENKPEFHQVFTPETAFQMSKIMEEVVLPKTSAFWYPGSAENFGYIKNNREEHIDTAAKTGTTDQSRDKWIALFTPYYTTATWYGFDNNVRTSFVNPADSQASIRISYDAMRVVHEDLPGREWNRPATIVEAMISIDSGQLASDRNITNSVHTTRAMMEYFVAGSPLLPTEYDPILNGTGAPINRLKYDQDRLREEDRAKGYGKGE